MQESHMNMISFTNILTICLIAVTAEPTGVARSCGPPKLPKHSLQVEAIHSNYPDSTNIHYKCQNDFSFDDGNFSNKIECVNGVWLPLKMTKCKGVCDPPSTPKNGSYKALKRSPLDGLFRINTKIEYECNPGYAIKGGRKVATCLKRMNRTGWFPSEVPQCVDNTCSELTVGSHVKYSPMKVSYKSGAIVTVSCWPGYKLNRLPSGNTVKCVNGSWNPSVTPNCSMLTCSSEKLLHGTEVSRGPYIVGKQARYVCNQGYILLGSSVLNCVEKNSEASWNEDLPICLTRFQFKRFCKGLAEEIVQRDGKYSCAPKYSCGSPMLPKHSSQQEATQENYPHGTKIHYNCGDNTIFEDCKTQHQIECIKGNWLPQKMMKCKDPQSNTRQVECGSKSSSMKPLIIGIVTSGVVLILMLLLVFVLAIQRHRLVRNGGYYKNMSTTTKNVPVW